MKPLRILTLVALLLIVLVILACTSVSNAAAKPVAAVPHSQFGVIETEIAGPSSTAVTAEFTVPFENVPVCTDAIQPTTLSAPKVVEVEGEFDVVLMSVTANDVTFFVNNTYATTEGVVIHWHCIGQ